MHVILTCCCCHVCCRGRRDRRRPDPSSDGFAETTGCAAATTQWAFRFCLWCLNPAVVFGWATDTYLYGLDMTMSIGGSLGVFISVVSGTFGLLSFACVLRSVHSHERCRANVGK